MKTGLFLTGALAAGFANAWKYPNCEHDNCYNNLIDKRYAEEAKEFCFEFLDGTTTDGGAIPTHFGNCKKDVTRVSSACSCITYTATHTTGASTTTTPVVITTTATTTDTIPTTTAHTSETTKESSTKESTKESSTHETTQKTTETTTQKTTETATKTSEVSKTTETSAQTTKSSEKPHTNTATSESTTQWTTSTIWTTSVHTVTQCPETVTDCPNGPHVTTETIVVSTTVCPVTSTEDHKPTTTVIPTGSIPHPGGNVTSTQYTTKTYTITSCPADVTDCPTGKVTTTVIPTGTTCIPVWTSSVKPTPGNSGKPAPGNSDTAVLSLPPTPTTTGPAIVTGAAGRVGIEAAAAVAAGLLAFL